MNYGYVYLLAEWGTELRYKIGATKNDVSKRVKQLKTGNSNDIIVVETYKAEDYYKIEKVLHRIYAPYRVEGEWFELSDEKVATFLTEAQKADENIRFLKNNNHFFQ